VHDTWPPFLKLLLAAAAIIVVLAWRLVHERSLALTYQAAASREVARKVAANARSLRAVDGEVAAFALLERAGYAVLERQVVGSWTVRADGEPVTFGLRADYLVARQGRRYIAEVKTGRLAPRLSHGPTRRQLLEYGAAFDVDGVILVDADAETLVHVDIDLFARDRAADGASKSGPRAATVALVAVLSMVLGAIVTAAMK
jgi:hypothetical protein